MPTERQTEAHEADERFIMFGGALGGGKALDVDTPILTIDGWSTMGEIKPSDIVFDENGNQTKVIRCSNVYYNRPCYRVFFDDGSIIIADEEHQWLTLTTRERMNNARRTDKYRQKKRFERTGKLDATYIYSGQYKNPIKGNIRTTVDIKNSLYNHDMYSNHSIAIAKSLYFPEKDLEIPPYTLGAWLGDGHSVSGAITIAEVQIVKEIRKDGFIVSKQQASKYTYTIRGLIYKLRASNLFRNKHIPMDYLLSSIEQRLALLQGLMDTDGFIDKSGKAVFAVIKKELAEGVYDLAISLGIKATLTVNRNKKFMGQPYKPVYAVRFRSELNVCRLKRKLDRIIPIKDTRVLSRYIKKIESIDSIPVKCIEVDSRSHLYLAGKSLIKTHNSCWMVNEAIRLSTEFKGNRGYLSRWENVTFKKTTLLTLQKFLQSGIIRKHNKSEQFYELNNDSIIFYGGLRGSKGEGIDRIKSMELGWFGIDEATEVPSEDFFLILLSRLRHRLPDGTLPRYKGLLASNPGVGWVKTKFKTDIRDNYLFVPALPRDNPYNPPEYEQSMRDNFSQDWIDVFLEGSWDIALEGMYVFEHDWVKDAVEKKMKKGEPCEFGIDVAREGKDETVVACRNGNKVRIVFAKQKAKDIMKATGEIAIIADKEKPSKIRVDTVGVGGGMYDRLKELGYPVEEFKAGNKSSDPDKYFDLKAEVYWKFRGLIEAGLVDLPDDQKLKAQLTATQYEVRSDKKLKIWSKDKVKSEGLQSPDRAEAVITSFFGRIAEDHGGLISDEALEAAFKD